MLDAITAVLDSSVGEHHLGTGILECIAQLGGRVPLVEGHEHHPRARHRLVDLEVAVTVATDYGHPVAVSDTECMERPHQTPHSLPGLTVGE